MTLFDLVLSAITAFGVVLVAALFVIPWTETRKERRRRLKARERDRLPRRIR